MAMTAAGRGQAIYQALQNSNQYMAKLSALEASNLLSALTAIWGTADLGYITANAQVNPGSLNTPKGATVSTTGTAAAQSGNVTSNVGLLGLGTVS